MHKRYFFIFCIFYIHGSTYNIAINDCEYCLVEGDLKKKYEFDEFDNNINQKDIEILKTLSDIDNQNKIEHFLHKHHFKIIQISKSLKNGWDITIKAPIRLQELKVIRNGIISNSKIAAILKNSNIKYGHIVTEDMLNTIKRYIIESKSDKIKTVVKNDGTVIVCVYQFDKMPTKIKFDGIDNINPFDLMNNLPLKNSPYSSSIIPSYILQFFEADTFNCSDHELIKNIITTNAYHLGYLDFTIKDIEKLDLDEDFNANIKIVIDEGKKYCISKIHIDKSNMDDIMLNNDIYDEIHDIALEYCNRSYSNNNCANLLNEIQKKLITHVIPLACQINFDKINNKEVNLELKIYETNFPQIIEIRILNNKTIRTSEIIKFIKCSEGDYFNPIAIQESINNIRRFYHIDVSFEYMQVSDNEIIINFIMLDEDNNKDEDILYKVHKNNKIPIRINAKGLSIGYQIDKADGRPSSFEIDAIWNQLNPLPSYCTAYIDYRLDEKSSIKFLGKKSIERNIFSKYKNNTEIINNTQVIPDNININFEYNIENNELVNYKTNTFFRLEARADKLDVQNSDANIKRQFMEKLTNQNEEYASKYIRLSMDHNIYRIINDDIKSKINMSGKFDIPTTNYSINAAYNIRHDITKQIELSAEIRSGQTSHQCYFDKFQVTDLNIGAERLADHQVGDRIYGLEYGMQKYYLISGECHLKPFLKYPQGNIYVKSGMYGFSSASAQEFDPKLFAGVGLEYDWRQYLVRMEYLFNNKLKPELVFYIKY